MNWLLPKLIRVADIAPVPWRNGGGVTRELLAWPDPKDWLLRVSVADIQGSGPFSAFPGVDRWFAVLEGGTVYLESVGSEAKELTAAQPALHAFSGDTATHCTTRGPATRDFNLMARRSHLCLRQHSLQDCPLFKSRAEGVGLFVVQAAELRQEPAAVWQLPAMALAWWANPRREWLSLRNDSTDTRGWWFDVDSNRSRVI
ncbi:MAG TPA: HutD family protein [Steroidobacteraceae bacterium]|nr:HutD family protein [Steroidobacteraceae bacterium]